MPLKITEWFCTHHCRWVWFFSQIVNYRVTPGTRKDGLALKHLDSQHSFVRGQLKMVTIPCTEEDKKKWLYLKIKHACTTHPPTPDEFAALIQESSNNGREMNKIFTKYIVTFGQCVLKEIQICFHMFTTISNTYFVELQSCFYN